MTDEELWRRMKPYALMDEDFLKRMDERQIEGAAWKIVKWVFGIILASMVAYAPAKIAEWVSTNIHIGSK